VVQSSTGICFKATLAYSTNLASDYQINNMKQKSLAYLFSLVSIIAFSQNNDITARINGLLLFRA